MEIVFMPDARKDLDFWVKTGNKAALKKIAQLIESVTENPFTDIGKPEPLKYGLTGTWSRRINQGNRLIYEVLEEKILIHSLRVIMTKFNKPIVKFPAYMIVEDLIVQWFNNYFKRNFSLSTNSHKSKDYQKLYQDHFHPKKL
jgi:toxin YoeB